MFDPINAPYSRNCFYQMVHRYIHIYTICTTSVKYMPNCNQNLFQTLQKLQKSYIANLKKPNQFSCSNKSNFFNLKGQILNIAKCPVIAVINVVTVGTTDTFRNA